MKHTKALLLVLLICCMQFGCAFAAELPSEQVDYYILFERDETAFGNTLCQDVISPLTYAIDHLYPDFVNVNFHVYSIRKLQNTELENNFELLYSGQVGTEEDKTALYTALSAPDTHTDSARAEKSLARLVKGLDPTTDRIILMGSISLMESTFLKDNIPNTLPFCIMTTNPNLKPSPTIMPLDTGNPLVSAKFAYDLFVTDLYDQQISEVLCSQTEYTIDPAGAQKCRILLSSALANSPAAVQTVWQDDTLTLLECTGEESVTLQLPATGLETRILIDRLYVPFELSSTLEILPSYTMSDDLQVGCKISVHDQNKGYSFEPSSWDVHATLFKDSQQIMEEALTYQEGTYLGSMDLREIHGEYNLVITAKHTAPYLDVSVDVGTVSIVNAAPEFIGQNKTPEYEIWVNAPIALENTLSIDLSTSYQDDGGSEHLRYSTADALPAGIVLQGTELFINPAELTGDALITVQVIDLADESNSDLCISIKLCDAGAMLDGGTATLGLINSEPVYKDTAISLQAVYTLPQSAEPYLFRLQEAGHMDAFNALLHCVFAFNDFDGRLQLQPAEGGYSCTSEWTDTRELGQYPASASIQLGDTGISLASAETVINVINRQPEINLPDAFQCSYTAEIPGPLFLYPNVPTTETTFFLQDVLTFEALDKFTVHFTSDAPLQLYQAEDHYLYTNEADLAYPTINQIDWDTDTPSPKVIIRFTEHGEWGFELHAADDAGAIAVGSPLIFAASVQYHQERMLITIALAVIATILLIIVLLIIHQITKPCYSEEDVLHVVYRHYAADIPAASWKKHGITLQEILIYGGIPIISALPARACRCVTFMPGRRNKRILIRNAKRFHLKITIDGAIQDSNKIPLQPTNVIEIHLNDQDMLLITLPD